MKKAYNSNKVKFLIFGTIILVFVGLLFMAYKINKKSDTDSSIAVNFKTVTDHHLYFFIVKNINNFIQETSDDKLYSLLNKNYIEENKLTSKNLISVLKYNSESHKYKVKEMKNYDADSNVVVYYINGDVCEEYEDKVIEKDIKYIVYIDYNNLTYAVRPIDKLDVKKISDEINKNYSIEKSNNSFEGTNLITTNDICLAYLSDYMSSSIDRMVELTTNFSDSKKLQKYIEDNNLSPSMKSCTNNSGRTYTVVDVNNNVYRFNEESIMNYTVTIVE